MKRLLMHFAFGLLVLLPRAHAALVLDEPFSYPDGPLTLVAEGLWVTHGGTSNQVDVSAGRVNLTQAESEDVNAELAGGPFRGPALYAGFTVNFSALPSGAGAYYAHFKDSTATGFRARVYAGTNGAGPGKWRAGVATGAGTAVFIPTDLDLGADYALVLRYDTATPASTLWINPTGENSTRERATAEDSATAVAITSFGLRQALTAGAGMGTLRLDQLRVGTAFLDVVQNFNPRLDPPAISAIPDQSVPANISTPAVPFVVRDDETAADNLLLHATSDNPGLVAVSGVAFGGGGTNRTVTVTPTPGRQGAARVTITVTDADGNTANGTFQVTVGVPSLSAVPDQIAPHDTTAGPIPFTVGDAEGDTLNLWGTSTNETLLPVAGLHFVGTGTARSVVLEPASGHTGLSRVTLFVSDGFNTVSNSFLLTVFPTRGVLLQDDFNYADGPLTTNSLFTWVTHGASTGQTGQTQVAQGELALSGGQSEDLHANLTDPPYPPSGAWMLYTRFKVKFIGRPSGGGDYFAHFRGLNSGSGARVFAVATGAPAGKARLGLANASADSDVVLPLDLDTNVSYTVVTRLNVATGQSTLWINPVAESDLGITAADEASPFEIWSYAFRQATGIGTLRVDELRVGTSFQEVSDAGFRLQAVWRAGQVEVSWARAAEAAGYRLQTSAAPGGSWGDVTLTPTVQGDRLVLRLPAAGARAFFRLIK